MGTKGMLHGCTCCLLLTVGRVLSSRVLLSAVTGCCTRSSSSIWMPSCVNLSCYR